MGRKAFSDFVEIRNLKNGAWVDGKMVSVKFDLRIGPFYIFDISWHPTSGSLRFPCRGGLKITFCRYKYGHTGKCEWVSADSNMKPKSFDQCNKLYWDDPQSFAERARKYNEGVGK